MYPNFKSCALTLAFSLLASVSFAQELTETHLAAAKTALTATEATDSFDTILLGASAQLKNQLTGNSPDKAEQIGTVVDEEAIALAPRRRDLEGEAARLFATTFSETDLVEITTFFNSPAGAKYLKATPVLARELGKSARVWANGITRDLQTNVQKKLAESGN